MRDKQKKRRSKPLRVRVWLAARSLAVCDDRTKVVPHLLEQSVLSCGDSIEKCTITNENTTPETTLAKQETDGEEQKEHDVRRLSPAPAQFRPYELQMQWP